MSEFDQLGLFCNNQATKIDVPGSLGDIISMTIEFSNESRGHDVDQVMDKIRGDIEKMDPAAVIRERRHTNKPWFQQPFFAIDVETTGLDAASNRIIELAIIPFNMGERSRPFCKLFCVPEPLPAEIVQITGISDDMLREQPSFSECVDDCIEMLQQAAFLVAYNAKFDRPFLESEMARVGRILPELPWVDPYVFICELDRFKRGKKLSDAAKRWGVSLENAHRASADASAAGQLLLKLQEKLACHSLYDLLAQQKLWQWQNAHSVAEYKRSSSWSVDR